MKQILVLIFSLIISLTACNKQEKGVDISQISFEISSPYGEHFITDYDIVFKAVDNDGNDITNAVVFKINGNPVQGSTYRFTNAGTYTVTADWDLGGGAVVESQNSIQAQVEAPRNPTYVLIEDFTGTWCVNCPRVTYKLEQAMAQNNKIVAVAIHDKGFQNDPFHFDDVNILTNAYNISGYPTPLLNRESVWDEELQSITDAENRTKPLGIRMENQLTGNQVQLTVKVRFDMDLRFKNLKLVVFALENNLHADQANSTNYYGGQDPIPNFEHNHVLRYSFTHVLGDDIPSGETAYNNEYTWTYSGPLPANIADPAHVDFVAFVMDADNTPGTVINAKKVSINQTADY